jgi:deferrochelatase/peroxidase EfeB
MMPIFDPNSDTVTGPEIPNAPQEPQLDVDEIQGAVVPGFGTKYQHLFALRFTEGDSTALRAWVAARVTAVSTLAEVMAVRNRRRAARRALPLQPPPRTPVMRAMALSIQGLAMLTGDAMELADEAVVGGMRRRSGQLGDPDDPHDDGHRSGWLFGGSEDTVPHGLLVLAAEWRIDIDEAVDAERNDLGGAQILWEQRGSVLEGGIEHFGFRDGVSQVGVRGRLSGLPRHFLTRRWFDPKDQRAKSFARPGQPLVWPGQFVFGYPRGSVNDALDPGRVASGGPAWTKNGSLLVLRRLRQDVAAFRQFLETATTQLHEHEGFDGIDADRLAAKLVGRWPDGTALMRSPHGPDSGETTDMLRINAFSYGHAQDPASVCSDPLVAGEELAAAGIGGELRKVAGAPADPTGDICPSFAHIRKVNPRDLPTDQGAEVKTRTIQMLRRGITWGQPFVDDEPEEARDRGLLFMSYQTDIPGQFELLTETWMNDPSAPEFGRSGHDLLVGQSNDGPRSADIRSHNASPTVQKLTAQPHQRWIIPTGGEYLFVPSKSTLQEFAAG